MAEGEWQPWSQHIYLGCDRPGRTQQRRHIEMRQEHLPVLSDRGGLAPEEDHRHRQCQPGLNPASLADRKGYRAGALNHNIFGETEAGSAGGQPVEG